jgi:hypothetical protein
MALRLEDKKALVAEVNEVAASAYSALAAEYRGLTVSEMTELRKQARDQGVYMRVVKNTLAKRAIEGTEFECMQQGLEGPLVLAFSQEDPGAAARVFKAFAKDHDKLVTRLVSIGDAADAGRGPGHAARRLPGAGEQAGPDPGGACRIARARHRGASRPAAGGLNRHSGRETYF